MSLLFSLGEKVKGIQFVSNDRGQKVTVQINLQKYGEIWEEFYDSLVARSRAKEPRESLESVKKSLIKQGKLCG